MLYEDFIKETILKNKGDMSLRTYAKKKRIDVSILSKILNDKYVPDEKTFKKWFPDIKFKTKVIIEFTN